MKGTMKKFFTTAMAACMLFSATACDQNLWTDSSNETADGEYSYLAIDINPSIELVIKDEIVVQVKACNEDAAVLLSGEDFTNMTVEEVSESIVELAEELGYLTEENDDVKITVSADSDKIIEKIKEFATKGAQKGSELAKVNNAPRSADERKVKELQEEDAEKYKGLNPAKLRLIEAIMAYDEAMTYELGATMKVSELADKLEDLAEEYGDIVGDELEALFEQTFENVKKSVKDKIAEQYGDTYKEAWERFVALEKVVKDIAKKAREIKISEEDMQAIMELLGKKAPEETPEAGEGATTFGFGHQGGHGDWRVEDYDDYFDRHHHDKFGDDKFEEIEEQIEAILEKYDEDNYCLTEEDLAALEAAWGEALEVVTIGDLEDFLDDTKDALEELRKEVEKELNFAEKAAIEIMEQTAEKLKDQALELIKEQIKAVQNEWQSLKEQKRGNK